MRISDILRVKGSDVVTTPANTTVRELIATLVENRIGAVIVVDGPRVLGVVSERYVVHSLHELGDGVLAAEVSQLMTSDVISCTPGDDIDTIAETRTEKRIRHMPVMSADRLVGVVSIGDVVKSRIAQLETETGQLAHYITG